MKQKVFHVIVALFVFGHCVNLANAAEELVFQAPAKFRWVDGKGNGKNINVDDPHWGYDKAEFNVYTPENGWYEMYVTGNKQLDIVVDGQYHAYGRNVSSINGIGKLGNIWLEKGEHFIVLQRLGRNYFPLSKTPDLALRKSDGTPNTTITAAKTLVDIVRVGENLVIEVTAGGSKQQVTYEILSRSAMENEYWKDNEWSIAKEISIPASDRPQKVIVNIPCDKDGMFQMAARVKGGKQLLDSEFPIGIYGVVDVNDFVAGTNELIPVHVIDCVKQTMDGQSMPEGSYYEANGPTRVVTTKAGTYRESHDSTPPAASPLAMKENDSRSFSCFAYHMDLPEAQVPYIIDIEFPDDTQRNVAVIPGWIDTKTGAFKRDKFNINNQYGKAYTTGGKHTITNTMRHHRVVVWAASKKLYLPLITQIPGTRAAASKIVVSKFDDNILPVLKAFDNGRIAMDWSEEGTNWRMRVNPPLNLSDYGKTFVGLERWARLNRYYGSNAIGGLGIQYLNLYWRSSYLLGNANCSFDECRLATLICEKYNMKFYPDIFRGSEYLKKTIFINLADKPSDIVCVNNVGVNSGNTGEERVNPLHPAVQKIWIDALGELADKLRDSKAFGGITSRSMEWFFSSDFHFPGFSWGYDDWTIAQFEQDSGINIPGKLDDKLRFTKRYEFLASEKMKEKWINWRSTKVMEYLKKLRNKIQGDRKDVIFAIADNLATADGIDEYEKALGCGLDPKVLNNEQGIARITEDRSSILSAAQTYRNALFKAASGTPYEGLREFPKGWAINETGVICKNAPYATNVFIPSGRNSLYRFARSLAVQDTMLFRYGSNSAHTGDPEIWRSWLTQFTSLPAVPFKQLATATDPIAVWSNKVGDYFYFYAVNSDDNPASITLKLSGADKLTRLDEQKTEISVKNEELNIDLLPYGLVAFRAPVGASIVSSKTTVSPNVINDIQNRLTFARDIEKSLNNENKGFVDVKQVELFSKLVDDAQKSFADGNYVTTKSLLSSNVAKNIYKELSRTPLWINNTRFPRVLQGSKKVHYKRNENVLLADELSKNLNNDHTVKFVDSGIVNPDWAGQHIIWADNGTIVFDLPVFGDGYYMLKIGQITNGGDRTSVTVNGKELSYSVINHEDKIPETAVFPPIFITAGTAKITLKRNGALGVYAMQFLPKIKYITNDKWSVIGPFDTSVNANMAWKGGEKRSLLLENDFTQRYPPEIGEIDIDQTYKTKEGKIVSWSKETSLLSANNPIISMAERVGDGSNGKMNIAVTFINSDMDREVIIGFGAEWWMDAYINDKKIISDISAENSLLNGKVQFVSHYPNVGTAHLKKGTNVLKIRLHGGAFQSYFSAFISDLPGITCSAVPQNKK